jgi:hypothetical protein
MDERGVNQKTYKDLKADISQNTAINIGYYWEVLNEIPGEVLIDTIKEIALNGWINNNTSEQELRNMLITESVKNMSYQEFKDIAHYFFGFVPDDEAMFQRVQPIEITRENYNYLVEQNKKAFGLERELNELKDKQNSLENKINNVETMIVPSESEVVGIDMKNEELLVLNSPLYSIIEEDLIIDDYLINDYRSRDNGDKQIIDYLRDEYKEIDLLSKEYILDNDTLYGEKLIFSYDIYEIDYDLIDEDQFKTLRDFYDFAKQFESFKEEYPMYPDYVESKYNDIYMYQDNPFNNYSSKILKNKIRDIQNILSKYNKKLITKDVTGYSQGEEWKLGYLADENQDNKLVEAYLENFVGAWYKGTLARLEIIPFESFDKGQLVGESTEINYINTDILPINNRGKLEKIKEVYPHLRQFKSKEEVLNKEKENNKKIVENRSKTIGGR